jgi:hypothetical protein
MELSDICTARPLLPHVPIGFDSWLASEPVWALWSREDTLATAGNRTLAVQAVARRYVDWAIAAPQRYYLKGCSCHQYFLELLILVAEVVLQAFRLTQEVECKQLREKQFTMCHVRLLWWVLRRLLSSWMWHLMKRQILTNVSEESAASLFRVLPLNIVGQL